MKAAIIYYSKSGVTEKIARKIQAKTDADFYFVEPDKKYGGYLSAVASVAVEKMKKKPAKTRTQVADFARYDVVFIGFPVWYYTAPQFVQDYIKACDLSGKRVIPFVTAGANGRESSYKTLQNLLPDSEITDYFYTSNINKVDVDAWLAGIKL